jgi:FlaA1/EpsC-like NDP-sugar epimerase
MAKVSAFPYLSHRIIFFADLMIAAVSFTLTCLVCSQLAGQTSLWQYFWGKLAAVVVISGAFFLIFKTHSRIIRYSTYRDAMRIFIAVLFANVFFIVINKIYSVNFQYSPLSKISFFINFLLTFGFIFFFRMAVRLLFDLSYMNNAKNKKKPILIYGVSAPEISLAKMINANMSLPYRVAGFVSPKTGSGQRIIGQPVYSRNKLFANTHKFEDIKAILIDPQHIERNEKRLLAEICYHNNIELLSVPPLEEWQNGLNTHKIKNINIEDLLRRPPIEINTESIRSNIEGKTVLVTGAAGSIGSEIVRQLCGFNPEILLLCDVAESPLHELNTELDDKFSDIKYIPLIFDTRNRKRMRRIFEKYHPQYVYHAAAYKHVPLMEMHPEEAVLTNVLGTKNVADLAAEYNAECFVMISTDKAVNPSNVMGASKRIAEIYVRILANHLGKDETKPHTRFITTRFGNVLGSNGSVVPRFTEQIRQGGPVTVTDPEIFRFFMTIPEACSLVLEAGNFGKGGEIFVFDMGESVKIKELAEEMIRLSGYEPYKDIDIVFTGLRPGEKLYEELLYSEEAQASGIHEKILIGKIRDVEPSKILPQIDELIKLTDTGPRMDIVAKMKEIVPEYISNNSIYCELDSIEEEETVELPPPIDVFY